MVQRHHHHHHHHSHYHHHNHHHPYPTHNSACHRRFSSCLNLAASSRRDHDEDLDESSKPQPGMAGAFRALEALESLMDDDDGLSVLPDTSSSSTAPQRIDATSTGVFLTTPSNDIAPEKEVELYKGMVQELESTDEEDLYSTVLQDMGGTKPLKSSSATTARAPVIGDIGDQDPTTTSREKFINDALEEALKEVKVNNPTSSVDSILNDKEIMKEIEGIFERGNEKLLESLEELRVEQVCVWSIGGPISPHAKRSVPLTLILYHAAGRAGPSQCRDQRPTCHGRLGPRR
jgi:hypothetical protein